MGRDDRLGATALEAGPQPVHVEGRPAASSLERRVARLADEGRQAEIGLIDLLVEGQGGERRPIGIGQGDHVVVEAGHPDPAIGPLERGDDLGEGVGRVLDRPAELARMEVDGGPDHVDLDVADARAGRP